MPSSNEMFEQSSIEEKIIQQSKDAQNTLGKKIEESIKKTSELREKNDEKEEMFKDEADKWLGATLSIIDLEPDAEWSTGPWNIDVQINLPEDSDNFWRWESGGSNEWQNWGPEEWGEGQTWWSWGRDDVWSKTDWDTKPWEIEEPTNSDWNSNPGQTPWEWGGWTPEVGWEWNSGTQWGWDTWWGNTNPEIWWGNNGWQDWWADNNQNGWQNWGPEEWGEGQTWWSWGRDAYVGRFHERIANSWETIQELKEDTLFLNLFKELSDNAVVYSVNWVNINVHKGSDDHGNFVQIEKLLREGGDVIVTDYRLCRKSDWWYSLMILKDKNVVDQMDNLTKEELINKVLPNFRNRINEWRDIMSQQREEKMKNFDLYASIGDQSSDGKENVLNNFA